MAEPQPQPQPDQESAAASLKEALVNQRTKGIYAYFSPVSKSKKRLTKTKAGLANAMSLIEPDEMGVKGSAKDIDEDIIEITPTVFS